MLYQGSIKINAFSDIVLGGTRKSRSYTIVSIFQRQSCGSIGPI